MKAALRQKYKRIKHEALTRNNTNSYHSNLLTNLHNILCNRVVQPSQSRLLIGSYINKPILQIIPPLLPSVSFGQANQANTKIAYAYPHFRKDSKSMGFYLHEQGQRYRVGDYGVKIKAQVQGEREVGTELAAVLVPLVAFHCPGKQRIGEGGGYYDYFIATTRQQQRKQMHRTLFIGVALEALKIDQECREVFGPWDQSLDYIITQKHIY